MKKNSIIVITMLIFLIFTSQIGLAQTKLSLGHIVPVDRPQHKALVKFAELVKERTDGEIVIEIYPAAQLGDGPEQVDGVSMGAQDMFNGGLTWWDQLSERIRLVEVPFMWESREHLENWIHNILSTKVQNKLIETHNQRFVDFGVLWQRGPHKAICSTYPIFDEPDDLKGLELRMYEGEVNNAVWNEFGASTTVMPWGDAYLAIKQGGIDAVTSPMDSIYGFAFHEVAPYITEIKTFPQITATTINEDVWNNLTSKQKDIMKKSLNEAGEYFNKLLDETVEPERVQMMNEGAKFIRINNSAYFEKAKEDIFPKLIEEGLINKDYFEEIQEVIPEK